MIALSFETVVITCAIGLLIIGALGLVLSSNLFRMLLALVVAEAGVNLLLVLAGYRGGAAAPILGVQDAAMPMVDPIPQVLVLTAIVIGVGVQALAVSVLLKIHQTYGTLDIRVLREHLELDIARTAGITPAGSREEPAGGRPLPPPIPATVSASTKAPTKAPIKALAKESAEPSLSSKESAQ